MGSSNGKCAQNEPKKSGEDTLKSLNLNNTETYDYKQGKAPMPVIKNEESDKEKENNQSGGDANNYTFEKYNIFKVLNELENMDARTVMEGGQEINFNSTTDDLKVMTKLQNAVNSKKPVNSYKNQPKKPITQKGGNAENKNPVIFRKPLHPPVNMPQKGGDEKNKNPVIFRKPLYPPGNMPQKATTQKGGNVENEDKNNFKTYLLDELNAQKGGGSKCATCNQSGGCGCEQSGGKKSKKSSSSSDSSSSDSSSSDSSSSSTSSTSSSSTSSDSVKQGGTSNDSYSRGLHIFPFESSITGGDSSYSSNHKLLRRHL
jgi:hypothetical protein